MKLHLGCGRQYLDGYVNIDFPLNHQTVQEDLKADRYADIRTLSFPQNSIKEIRLHHVFEHFTRHVALALLCRWRLWLIRGGLLRIETPDAMACFRLMMSPFVSFERKQQVMRAIFGSHEAKWAVHCDGWYRKKFIKTLSVLGFKNIRFAFTKWGMLRNIEVFAEKSDSNISDREIEERVKKLLFDNIIRTPSKENGNEKVGESELKMIEVWMEKWNSLYFQ